MDSDEDTSLQKNWTCRAKKLQYALRHETWRPKVRIAVVALVMAAVSLTYLTFFLK